MSRKAHDTAVVIGFEVGRVSLWEPTARLAFVKGEANGYVGYLLHQQWLDRNSGDTEWRRVPTMEL